MEAHHNFIRIELIDDPAAIAEFGFEARCEGDDLVCRRCGEATSIAAIMVVPAGGHARWALCANCLVELP